MVTGKEYGGYFGLELGPKRSEFHSGAVRINSGRYCLQYILRTKKYKKIYVPSYICNSVLQPITNENVSYEFYPINERFEPVFCKQIKDNECFLYVNYYGLNRANVNRVVKNFKNVIIDNSQSFFDLPHAKIDTFYSARKFFGVPDGAYLYTQNSSTLSLRRDISFDRMEHLLKRIDISAHEGYSQFQENESFFNTCGMHRMSKLTECLMSHIDYAMCENRRNKNLLFLHKKLGGSNELAIDLTNLHGPMVYPFMIQACDLKEKLIDKKIYVATYWSEVRERVKKDSFEYKLANYMIPLPVDQRYNLKDMECVVDSLGESGVRL